jgi:hypothetical protein
MEEPTAMKNLPLLLFLFTGTMLLFFVMQWHGKPLSQLPTTKGGIVSLEFAKTKQRADEIVKEWRRHGLQMHAIRNTYIDYLFIFFYSLFLFAANWMISLKQKNPYKTISQAIAFFSLTAALFDVIENFFLFKMLAFSCTDAEINSTWWLAAVKFLLAAIAVLWILINLLYFIIAKSKTLTL